MPTVAPTDSWENFNRLARETLQHQPLGRKELLETFFLMESLIFRGVDLLLQVTTFVEDNLCYLLAEIASGVIKSRKVYKGKRVRERVAMDDEGGVEMGAENRRILGTGFDLFKLSRMERDKAVPYVKRIIRTLRLSTGNYENMLIAFNKECSEYCATSDILAELTIQLEKVRNDPLKGQNDEAAILRQMAECIDKMNLIELNVGCVDPNYLYGTARAVAHLVKRIRLLQERVIKAYARLVLKPVREKARSEMEASDLYQSGIFGLSRAVSIYDARSGSSFPAFASYWIRQRILGSTKHSSPLIKLPGSVWEMYQKIKAEERRLELDPDKRYTYTVQDIADRLGTSVNSVEQVLRKIQSTRVVPLESLSHNSEEGTDDDASVDRALLDESVREDADYEERRDFVERILSHVDRNSRNLVCLRFGVLESVDNTSLDAKQVLKEIFRQTACRAVIQGTTAGAADDPGWARSFVHLEE